MFERSESCSSRKKVIISWKSFVREIQISWLYQQRYIIFSFGCRFGSNRSLFLIDQSRTRYNHQPINCPKPDKRNARSWWWRRTLSISKIITFFKSSLIGEITRLAVIVPDHCVTIPPVLERIDVYPAIHHEAYGYDSLRPRWILAKISCRFNHPWVSSLKILLHRCGQYP